MRHEMYSFSIGNIPLSHTHTASLPVHRISYKSTIKISWNEWVFEIALISAKLIMLQWIIMQVQFFQSPPLLCIAASALKSRLPRGIKKKLKMFVDSMKTAQQIWIISFLLNQDFVPIFGTAAIPISLALSRGIVFAFNANAGHLTVNTMKLVAFQTSNSTSVYLR